MMEDSRTSRIRYDSRVVYLKLSAGGVVYERVGERFWMKEAPKPNQDENRIPVTGTTSVPTLTESIAFHHGPEGANRHSVSNESSEGESDVWMKEISALPGALINGLTSVLP